MATAPKSSTEHRSFADHVEIGADEVARSDGRHLAVESRPGRSDGADVDLQQGRFGNLDQNLTAIRNVQDR